VKRTVTLVADIWRADLTQEGARPETTCNAPRAIPRGFRSEQEDQDDDDQEQCRETDS
jgi:hypothetical protein